MTEVPFNNCIRTGVFEPGQISGHDEYYDFSVEREHNGDEHHITYVGEIWANKGGYKDIRIPVTAVIDPAGGRGDARIDTETPAYAHIKKNRITGDVGRVVRDLICDAASKAKEIRMSYESDEKYIEFRSKMRPGTFPSNPATNPLHAYQMCARAQKKNGCRGMSKDAIRSIIKTDPADMLREYGDRIKIVKTQNGDMYVFDTRGVR